MALLQPRALKGQMRTAAADYVSAYLRVDVATASPRVEAAIRSLAWPRRNLRWMDAKWTDDRACGCGFDSADAYPDSESEQALPPWVWLPPGQPSACPVGLIISCRLDSAPEEPVAELAAELLQWVSSALGSAPSAPEVRAAVVLLVSRCPRLPFLSLPNGLADLTLTDSTDGFGGLSLLQRAGMLALRAAVSCTDVAALTRLAERRIGAMDARLRQEGHAQGLGGGDYSYAEVCARGLQRWDMLLHAPAAAGAPDLELGASAGAEPADAALLERVARGGGWAATVHATLGADVEWQVSLICSRPEAPAGHWHSDGGHSRFTYGEEGESAPIAYALCAFVPLVALAPPSLTDGQVSHGSGCTVFWPGSHRQPACLQLGAAASTRLDAVVCGAPLQPGDALLYDYRTVHCGSPNQGAERPILQFTFSRRGYRDRFRNYGFHQLFYNSG
jgi:hypothetical protein